MALEHGAELRALHDVGDALLHAPLADHAHDVVMGQVKQSLQVRQDKIQRLQNIDAIRRAHGFQRIEHLMFRF